MQDLSGVMKFEIVVCATCKTSDAEHAKRAGERFLFGEVSNAPTLPDGCGCRMKAVGSCRVCGQDVDALGPAAQYHMDVAIMAAPLIAGAPNAVTNISFCGNCVTMLARGIFDNQEMAPMVERIIRACAPKVVPAGSASVIQFPRRR